MFCFFCFCDQDVESLIERPSDDNEEDDDDDDASETEEAISSTLCMILSMSSGAKRESQSWMIFERDVSVLIVKTK